MAEKAAGYGSAPPVTRAGHLIRLRAEETQGKSPSPEPGLSWSQSPSGAFAPSPRFAGLPRHAVGEDFQAASHLRTKSRRCSTYSRAAPHQNPGGACSSMPIKLSSY
ncbi:microtubule-associated proteins 1A/1B light chain 3B isoform X2 [Erinaceus europaeus]|uniref:Microtubule-associated proteins 1A/1B light chain 3B isoform X2 n=1 Tax=Erinaceus europaeus TaxID=9365 RepID=A0ABM3WWS6_ERIEU|nr:microtubule-associated proteins 1A/1B light chain 3B isoform X2 [Erinaceus europaeus]